MPYQPPPAWLVVGGEVVQASYGYSCEEGRCSGQEPQRQADSLAVAEVPAGEEVLVVVGSDGSVDVSAGVVGWEDVPDGPTSPSATFTEAGIPFFMQALDVQLLSEEERPAVEFASGGDEAGRSSVYELASTDNPGDRLLSVYANTRGQEERGERNRIAYHWRLDPGEEGENPPPVEEKLPEVVELKRGPETTGYPPEEVAEQASSLEVKRTSFGHPDRIEVGEGCLWVLDL